MTYNFGYQGQEKDPETGLNNFELRQYDARLGRWFNPDPKGQYHSPYLAMANNPVSSIDPDGGSDYFSEGSRQGDASARMDAFMDWSNYRESYGISMSFHLSMRSQFVEVGKWMQLNTVDGTASFSGDYYGKRADGSTKIISEEAVNAFFNKPPYFSFFGTRYEIPSSFPNWLRSTAGIQNFGDGYTMGWVNGMKGSYNFLTKDAWKSSTWTGMLSFGHNLNPLGGMFTPAGMVQTYGISQRVAAIPEQSPYEWGELTGGLAYNLLTGYLGGELSSVANTIKIGIGFSTKAPALISLSRASKYASLGAAAKGFSFSEKGFGKVLYKRISPNSSAGWKSLNPLDNNHFFSRIIDNYTGLSSKFTLKGSDGIYRSLYQIEGSLRGKQGVFEWIIETGGDVTHRAFIPGGKITGIPNKW